MAIRLSHEDGPRLRVAVVGCGGHAYRSVFPSLDYVAVDLVAVCDLDPVRAKKYARRFGAQDAHTRLKDVIARGDLDAILLSVGAPHHPELACEALEGGLHVWMEKPPSTDVGGVQRMIEARGRSGKRAAVGFKKAFMPATRKMKEVAERGTLGALTSLSGRYPMSIPHGGMNVLADKKGNNWLGNGVHPLSLFVFLAGRPDTLTAYAAPNGGGFVVMQFPSGAVGCLHNAEGSVRGGPMERYEAVFEQGHVVNENNARVLVHRPGLPFDYRRGYDFTAGPDEAAAQIFETQHTLSTLHNKAIFLQGFVQELEHFVEACLKDEPVTIGSLEQARAVMECYEAGLLSGGKPVNLDELPALRG